LATSPGRIFAIRGSPGTRDWSSYVSACLQIGMGYEDQNDATALRRDRVEGGLRPNVDEDDCLSYSLRCRGSSTP